MTPSPRLIADVRSLLADEIKGVEEFIELLRQEQALLVQPVDVDALLALVSSKNDISTRLGQLASQRERLIAADSGAPADRQALETWIGFCPPADPIRELWARLLELAAQAQALNETNGRLINIHLQHNQQALMTLMHAANRAVTYDAGGQPKAAGGGRLLGSA